MPHMGKSSRKTALIVADGVRAAGGEKRARRWLFRRLRVRRRARPPLGVGLAPDSAAQNPRVDPSMGEVSEQVGRRAAWRATCERDACLTRASLLGGTLPAGDRGLTSARDGELAGRGVARDHGAGAD